jgi:hypothetical protein
VEAAAGVVLELLAQAVLVAVEMDMLVKHLHMVLMELQIPVVEQEAVVVEVLLDLAAQVAPVLSSSN